ncbi:GspMb/PilO family protein [Inhella sp.]|uniref:GspMb/PilO family protein n=1 Tax=Inhella sp. TaxID=1921806 RepID=UPI0035AF8A56
MSALARLDWRRMVAQLQDELRRSRLLRLGLLAIAALVWAEGLMRLQDRADAWREEAAQLRAEQARMQPGAEAAWQARAESARKALSAWRDAGWPAQELGLAEAELQDRVRSLAAAAALPIRELQLRRPEGRATQAADAADTDGRSRPQAVHLRLVVELNRAGLLALLVELERQPHALLVDRLVLRTASQPAVAELDLRAPISLPTLAEAVR